MPDPRWLAPAAAADYLGCRVDALPRLVRQGRIPAPNYGQGPRSPRYDRLALDKAMGAGAASRDPDQMAEAWLEKQQEKRAYRAA